MPSAWLYLLLLAALLLLGAVFYMHSDHYVMRHERRAQRRMTRDVQRLLAGGQRG